jgi:hypothetical protein
MTQWRDDDEADLHDAEYPDASDQDEEDAQGYSNTDVEPCPFCQRFIYEGADVCNHCGNFIAFGELPRRSFIWAIAGVTAAVLALSAGLLYLCRW